MKELKQCIFSQQCHFNESLKYLKDKSFPKLNDHQRTLCEKVITEEKAKLELNKNIVQKISFSLRISSINVTKSAVSYSEMEVNKSIGNDGLIKEFYEAFLDHLKVPLLLSFKTTFLRKELSTSQKQAVIKLIEKRDRDKRFINK